MKKLPKTQRTLAGLATFALLTPGTTFADPVGSEAIVPEFDPANFDPGAAIDNPFFPLEMGYGAVIHARGVDADGERVTEESRMFYGGPGRVILGVQTTVQRDLAFENGVLVEDTFDYYAQDRDGNVWYMGEDVTNYVYDDDGNLIETNDDSAWIAGENGARPGWIMSASPEVGLAYFQEVADDDAAVDEAVVWRLGQIVEAGGRTFEGVLVTYETSQIDQTAREFKFYAPGVGLIRVEEDLDARLMHPALTFELIAATHTKQES